MCTRALKVCSIHALAHLCRRVVCVLSSTSPGDGGVEERGLLLQGRRDCLVHNACQRRPCCLRMRAGLGQLVLLEQLLARRQGGARLRRRRRAVHGLRGASDQALGVSHKLAALLLHQT